MRTIRKIVLLPMLYLLVAICFSTQASAAPPPAEKAAKDAVIESTLYLANWNCTIAKSQGNAVAITGFSEATQNVDKIWVTIYLQKWDGTKWVNVSSGYYQEKTNDSYVTAAKTLTVTPGNYYRTKSQHQCIKGGVKDPASPVECVSQNIYISK